ncbi:MAG: hypothetical protein JXB62_05005 [Pirellulales bacterium]|nr:hypothetical protein [Pirellulales bacterium]
MAFYLGVLRGTTSLEQQAPSGHLWAFRVLAGLGTGTALGALVLWTARHYRGLPFPKHPGEYLWLVHGAAGLVMAAACALLQLFNSLQLTQTDTLTPDVLILHSLPTGAAALAFLIAAVRLPIRRWRVFLLLAFATELLWILSLFSSWMWAFYEVLHWSNRLLYFLCNGVLVTIVIMDLLQRRRYPWTHWVGIAINLWLCVIALAFQIWATFFRESSTF